MLRAWWAEGPNKGREMFPERRIDGASAMAFRPDGRQIACVSAGGDVALFSVPPGAEEGRLGTRRDCPLCDLERERGGETACYAHLVCPECGAVLNGDKQDEGCNHGA